MIKENPTRRYDPEATRSAILTSARRTFMEKGVARTTLSEIARASSVTKSLIHHHFGSKEELWNEVKRDTFRPYFEGILEIIRGEEDDLSCLANAITFMFRFYKERPELSRLMTLMHWEDDRSCVALEETVVREGIERLRRAQADGKLRDDIDPWVLQTSFLNLITGWFLMRPRVSRWGDFDLDDPQVDETYLQQMLALFMEGVQPRRPT